MVQIALLLITLATRVQINIGIPDFCGDVEIHVLRAAAGKYCRPLRKSRMSLISKFLFMFGFVCLGLYGYFMIQANIHQSRLERELYRPATPHQRTTPPQARVKQE